MASPQIVATYNYVDEQGNLLYQVVRYNPKDFRQRRPKVGGGWEYTVKGTRLVPYRLPELLAASERGVLIVEGEKDADRAASIGIIATTCAMGAGKWRPEYNEFFRGRSVYIIPDNDKPGREHGNQVAMSLHGIAKAIKVVELPGVPEKGDLSDWLDQGGTRDKLSDLLKVSPLWNPSPGDKQAGGIQAAQSPSPRHTFRFLRICCPRLWPTSSTKVRRPLAAMSPTSPCPCWPCWHRRWAIHGASG